ncbi:MAG: hypothetical protein FJW36_19055 [Acidobacteria bacterium]|nr:hypothetical protein [Acidobacteriota bacterium]
MLAAPKMAKNVLWIDCLSGAIVGCYLLLLSGWLSGLYGIPQSLVVRNGMVNLAYACFSFSLAMWKGRPAWMVGLLAVANASWMVVCAVAAWQLAGQATVIGLGTIVFEGMYVGWLASVEWAMRERLGQR